MTVPVTPRLSLYFRRYPMPKSTCLLAKSTGMLFELITHHPQVQSCVGPAASPAARWPREHRTCCALLARARGPSGIVAVPRDAGTTGSRWGLKSRAVSAEGGCRACSSGNRQSHHPCANRIGAPTARPPAALCERTTAGHAELLLDGDGRGRTVRR